MNQFTLRGKNVSLRKPSYEELEYVKWLWADEETMKATGGPINFREEDKKRWYEIMVSPSNGKHFYCLIFNKENKPVGEVSFHKYDKIAKTAEFNIKIANPERGKGYASEATKLLLDYYFNVWNGEIMRDSIAIDNTVGQKALLNLGFEKVYSDEKVFLAAMTKEKFNRRYKKEVGA
ncbi:GNAT family N-acetyltransferase [Heyndrickxia sp. NPDC080065]|uniref:GNAT family N-acetyltransferase n=1 Tax=Heyndrickxia sp. NPDC080065 TaxID=3390568 RepID=UPI003D0161C5